MEENFPWKIIFIAALFSLLVLGIVYFLISPRESTFFSQTKIEKIAEFENPHVEGRKDGKKSWIIFAKSGWTNKTDGTTYLINVSKGSIYKEDKLFVANLSAPLLKMYQHGDLLEAFGQPEGKSGPSRLQARIDLGKIAEAAKKESDWTSLVADHVKFFPTEKKSEIEGHVSLKKKGSHISADRININHETKVSQLLGSITIKRDDGKIQADSLLYSGIEEKLEASGSIFLDLRQKKIRTNVKCSQATLFNDLDKDINLSGSLEVVQGKKHSIAREGIYSKKHHFLHLSGETKTILEKAKALLNEKTVLHLKTPEVKNILREKTVVIADEISFSTNNGKADASGHVIVTQMGREAKADTAIYDEQKELITLSGNVFMRKKDEWISCQRIEISIPKEMFEAYGVTEAKLKL